MTELIKPLPSYLDKESRKPEATDVIREGNRAAQSAIIAEAKRRGDEIEYYITTDAREFSKIDDKYLVSFRKALSDSQTADIFDNALGFVIDGAVLFVIVMLGSLVLNMPLDQKASLIILSVMLIGLGPIVLTGVVLGLFKLFSEYDELAYIKKHGFRKHYLDSLLTSARTLIGVGGQGLYYVTNPSTAENLNANLCHYGVLDRVVASNRQFLIFRDGSCFYDQDSYEAWGEGKHSGVLENDLNSRIEKARVK